MITEKLTVLVPTQEDWDKVVQCMLDNGNMWPVTGGIQSERWEKYNELTKISISYYNTNEITYGCNDHIVGKKYTAQEFLDKYQVPTFKYGKSLPEPTNKIMTITNKFALAFKKEPEKSFIKAGITDNEGFLTVDGGKIFLSWLLKKNGDAFKAEVVDDLLKEDKAE